MNKIATAKLTIIPALSLTIVLGACGKDANGLIRNSEAKSSTGWAMKVIDASQPGTVNIQTGGTELEKAEAPPANQKWVLLTAELTPGSDAPPFGVRQVKLVDGSANGYAALAMAGAADKGSPSFVYFKDSPGLGQISWSGQILWVIMKHPVTGETIVFTKFGGEKVYFLFAVPSSAKNLTLQLSS